MIFAIPDMKCTPETLNLKSKGKWVTCSQVPPPEYSSDEISVSDSCGNPLCVPFSLVMDGDKELVKFNREKLIVAVSGSDSLCLTTTSVSFTWNGATDTIKVINPGKAREE